MRYLTSKLVHFYEQKVVNFEADVKNVEVYLNGIDIDIFVRMVFTDINQSLSP